MKDSFERLAMHLQDALNQHEAEAHAKVGLALRAAIATLHQAAIEVAAKTSELAIETAEVHCLTAELQANAKKQPTRRQRKNGAK